MLNKRTYNLVSSYLRKIRKQNHPTPGSSQLQVFNVNTKQTNPAQLQSEE